MNKARPIRFGICADLNLADVAARLGYDYIEGNLSELARMEDSAFQALKARIGELPIRVEAFNVMLPASIPVTGPNVNAADIHAYLDRAYQRAVQLGGEVVVFGSSGSRNPPDGFPMDVAWRQIVNFLRMAERHNASHSLTLAIEPLRRQECKILNLVSEAMAVASIVQLPNIRVLADTYHMAMCHEPLSVLLNTADMLGHVHTANSIGRTYPKRGDGEDYRALFSALKETGYSGRVSVEASTEDFTRDAEEALRVLKEANL